MEQTKEIFKAVSIPSQNSKLVKMNGKRCFSFSEHEVSYFNLKHSTPQDLLVISPEKIYVDDYILYYREGKVLIGYYPSKKNFRALLKMKKTDFSTNGISTDKINILQHKVYEEEYIGKIVASTNRLLVVNGVPSIHDNFVKLYSDSNGALEQVKKTMTYSNILETSIDYEPTEYNNEHEQSIAWLYKQFSDEQLNQIATYYHEKELWDMLSLKEKIDIHNTETSKKDYAKMNALDWWYSLSNKERIKLSYAFDPNKDWFNLSENKILSIYKCYKKYYVYK